MIFGNYQSFLESSPALALISLFLVAVSWLSHGEADREDSALNYNWYVQLTVLIAALLWLEEWAFATRRAYVAWSGGLYMYPDDLSTASLLLFGYVVPVLLLIWALVRFVQARRMIREDINDPIK
jgi:hypothetical protein